MEDTVELPVALPGLRAARVTTQALRSRVKEHYAVGRVERGHVEWWGGGQVWRSAPGCVLLKQPGDVHRDIARDGATTFTTISLPSDAVVRAQNGHKLVSVSQLAPADPRAAPFHRLVDAVCAGEDRLTLEVRLLEAISALAAASGERPNQSRPVRRALQQIRERFSDPITLDCLARHAGLDKFHLCRAFRRQVGISPHKYLMHVRVAHAKAHLQRGMRASEVASLVGFYDQPQLTRHFRRIVGVPPARWAGFKTAW